MARPGAIITTPVVNAPALGTFGSLWSVLNMAVVTWYVYSVSFVLRFIHFLAVSGIG
jgi:hypothetical protein